MFAYQNQATTCKYSLVIDRSFKPPFSKNLEEVTNRLATRGTLRLWRKLPASLSSDARPLCRV